jgi:NAD+ diphosphatase
MESNIPLGFLIYLGNYQNRDYFACQVEEFEPRAAERFLDFRPYLFELPEFDASLLTLAISIVDWNVRIKFCAGCGSKMNSIEGGFKKVCTNEECVSQKSVQNYCHPRTDPVVITCVVSPDGQSILLGRQKSWPPKRYSCLGIVDLI